MNDVDFLVRSEQAAQGGRLVQGISIDEYLVKIKEKAEFLFHYIDGRCAGFVAFYCNDRRAEQAFITLLLVSPEFRGMKVASNLLEGVLSIARSRGFASCQLEVNDDNYPALHLYEKFGFRSTLSEGTKLKMIYVL